MPAPSGTRWTPTPSGTRSLEGRGIAALPPGLPDRCIAVVESRGIRQHLLHARDRLFAHNPEAIAAARAPAAAAR